MSRVIGDIYYHKWDNIPKDHYVVLKTRHGKKVFASPQSKLYQHFAKRATKDRLQREKLFLHISLAHLLRPSGFGSKPPDFTFNKMRLERLQVAYTKQEAAYQLMDILGALRRQPEFKNLSLDPCLSGLMISL